MGIIGTQDGLSAILKQDILQGSSD